MEIWNGRFLSEPEEVGCESNRHRIHRGYTPGASRELHKSYNYITEFLKQANNHAW